MKKFYRPSSVRLVHALILTMVSATTLSGCGQKGPLYLPDQPKGKADPYKQDGTGAPASFTSIFPNDA